MARPIPFGKYYLLDRINVGGMAEVFRAKAFGVEGFERLVAVKRILPSVAEDTDFITMFIDEAKIAVQLSHANIAQIFDLGKVGDAYFIALEYVHGKDVRALFDHARDLHFKLPVTLSVYVMMKVCEGLDYAHNKRDASGRELELVHRDVSPQNVLVSFDGEVKLIDFGIAKVVGKAGRTEAGILKGKFGYLSPEQVRAEPIDRRSDVFGVGIVLHELLSGARLFAGDSDFSTIEKVRNSQIPAPSSLNPEVPAELDAIVLKALDRNLDARYQTAMELHDDLQRFLFGRGETFSRRELSAWMRDHFTHDAEQEGSDDTRPSPALRMDLTDISPILEPAEPLAVMTDLDEEASGKSTMLGMPVVAGANPTVNSKGRSIPPPPPPRVEARGAPREQGGDKVGSVPPRAAGSGRSVPPPPPAASAPIATLPGGVEGPVDPTVEMPALGAIPSVRVSSAPPRARSVPPPPPRSSFPPPIPNRPTPLSGVSAAILAATTPGTEPTPAPPAAAPPALDMDWDDEDLSTQIYDRPEEQLGLAQNASGTFEHVTSGYEEVSAHQNQAHVATYIPPSAHNGANGQRGYAQAARRDGAAEPGVALGAVAANSRAAQVTQSVSTQQTAPAEGSRALFAALAVATFMAACILAYFVLAPDLPGIVQLTTHPADATVLFDGEPIGTVSPFIRTGVSPGEKHVLEVRKEGFIAWSQEVQVQPGQTLELPITLQADHSASSVAEGAAPAGSGRDSASATGGFSLESVPAGAKVFLDGQELGGLTPLRVANLMPRSYEVTLKAPDFRDYTTRVEVRSGIDVALPKVALEPRRLQLRISSEPPGDVSVVRGSERRALGRTPITASLDNNGQAWTVEIDRDGFELFSQEITPTGTAQVNVNATLLREAEASSRPRVPVTSPRPRAEPRRRVEPSGGGGNGTLRVNSRPWSQVYVDGRLVGNTPQMGITLSEGSHRVTLTNPEFGLKKNLTVEIRANQTETQIINLQ